MIKKIKKFDELLKSTEKTLRDELKEYSQFQLDGQTDKARERLGVHFKISEMYRKLFEEELNRG